MKTFGFSAEDISKVSIDRNVFGTMLRDKIEYIVSDPDRYNKVIAELSKKVAAINEKIPSNKRFMANLLAGGNNPTSYEKKVDTLFDSFAEAIKNPPKGETDGFFGFARTAVWN